MPDSTGPISVQPVAGRIGAEITGVDIAEPLDQETVAVIQDALDTWKVVFFRGQHLDHAAQIAFGRQFGELTYAHPYDDDYCTHAGNSYAHCRYRSANWAGESR